MTQVHYFQRYSQRENVDTNNTLLLLSRIQVEDPRLLRNVLPALFSDSIRLCGERQNSAARKRQAKRRRLQVRWNDGFGVIPTALALPGSAALRGSDAFGSSQ